MNIKVDNIQLLMNEKQLEAVLTLAKRHNCKAVDVQDDDDFGGHRASTVEFADNIKDVGRFVSFYLTEKDCENSEPEPFTAYFCKTSIGKEYVVFGNYIQDHPKTPEDMFNILEIVKL